MSDEFKKYFDANKAWWNNITPAHIESDFYDNGSFLAGKNSLNDIELPALGDISNKKVLHIQCHFGQDSISMARMGAEVTATDISDVAIAQARHFNDVVGTDVNFIECNTYDILNHINEKFDLIFMSYGVLAWLPDMEKLADICGQLIRKGGSVIIAEFHPTLYLFDFSSGQIAYPYFNTGVYKEITDGDYADLDDKSMGVEYFWCHSLEEIMGAFLQEDFNLKIFKEYDYSPYNCFPNMRAVEEGKYQFSEVKVRIPHVFLLKLDK